MIGEFFKRLVVGSAMGLSVTDVDASGLGRYRVVSTDGDVEQNGSNFTLDDGAKLRLEAIRRGRDSRKKEVKTSVVVSDPVEPTFGAAITRVGGNAYYANTGSTRSYAVGDHEIVVTYRGPKKR